MLEREWDMDKDKNTLRYTFYLVRNLADFLSIGMASVKSGWTFVWDDDWKNFKAINKDGKSVEIHLKNISGKVRKKPDFNMSIFPRKVRRKIRRFDFSSLKDSPRHLASGWKLYKNPDRFFDQFIVRGRIRTLNQKLVKTPAFRRASRNRLANAHNPITKA
jgi:hypothetical protein